MYRTSAIVYNHMFPSKTSFRGLILILISFREIAFYEKYKVDSSRPDSYGSPKWRNTNGLSVGKRPRSSGLKLTIFKCVTSQPERPTKEEYVASLYLPP